MIMRRSVIFFGDKRHNNTNNHHHRNTIHNTKIRIPVNTIRSSNDRINRIINSGYYFDSSY